MASNTDEELHRMVKGIVDDLEAATAGNLYDVDGNYVVIDDLDGWKAAKYEKLKQDFEADHPRSSFKLEDNVYESYEEWMEDEIGTVDDVDEPDEVSLSDYVEKESLGDVRFEVDSSKELQGGKVLFCYGGPNVWVADDEVRGYWGSSTVEMSLDSDTRSALFSWFEEQWDIIKG